MGAVLEDRSGGSVNGGLVPPGDRNGSAFVEALKTRRYDMGLTGRWPVGDERVLSVRASATSRDLDQTFGDVLEPSKSTTAFAETALSGVTGAHHWVIGLALQHDSYKDEVVRNFNCTYNVPGLFVQDEIPVGESATLSTSARLDQHNIPVHVFATHETQVNQPLRISKNDGFGAFCRRVTA